MGLLLPVLLAFLAALIGGLYLLGVFRQRRSGEPPLDKGLIPWLGHVLEFRRNTLKFLERMKQKHGDVFTVQLGGYYVTFLQDPLSFGAFVKERRENLDFNKFAEQLVRRVFGYIAIEDDHEILHMSSNKYLKGDGLELLTQSMMSNLQNLMLYSINSEANQRTWKEDGLFMYSYNILFRAGYLSLYGNVPPKSLGSEEKAKEKDRAESEALFYEFRKYDQLFPNLAYGVLPPRKRMEAWRLLRLFWDALSVHKIRTKDNISGWVWDMQQAKEERGMSESMINRYMFLLLWASQGNTGPAAFWLLLFLMKHPEAMTAMKEGILDFLTARPQRVRVGSHMSTALTLSTGSPQGCVLSPLLYTLYTQDCTSTHPSNTIIKFADDTTVVGLISGNDESAYRDEVEWLSGWCRENNLILNTAKTKELVVDFRRNKTDIKPLFIDGVQVERVAAFGFLGVIFEQHLSWGANTIALVKKAQQRLYFLSLLKRNNLNEKLLVSFYRCTIESILTYCVCAWFASCTAADRRALQRVITRAQKIIGCPLPSLEELYSSRCLKKAQNILQDPSHPEHCLFELLPSGRRYRTIKARTNRLRNSFYPRAIVALNAAKI